MSTLKNFNEYLADEGGWQDNTSVFIVGATSPANTPVYTDIGNGFYQLLFTSGDIGFLTFHIEHDILVGAKRYAHIHFGPNSSMVAGETIKWELSTVTAERDGLESFNVTPDSVTLTYTADGNEIAGCHRVIEVSEADAIAIGGVDSLTLMKAERVAGTYTGGVYGYTGDLHYQVGRLSTPNKAYPFV